MILQGPLGSNHGSGRSRIFGQVPKAEGRGAQSTLFMVSLGWLLEFTLTFQRREGVQGELILIASQGDHSTGNGASSYTLPAAHGHTPDILREDPIPTCTA